MDNVISINITTRKILITVLAIQLALLGSIGLDKISLEIPILRQLVGFVYLTFVPGFLIFRILKIRTNALETFLFSIGLSISFVMFTGFTMNNLYPLIGIEKPISEVPLLITFSVVILFLCILFYLRDKNYSVSFKIDLSKIMSPRTLFFALLPFIAIFGTYLVNFYDKNVLLLILLITISAIPVLVAFHKIPEKKFPVVVWSISLALLFHNSLVGKYLLGYDCVYEYFLANLVKTTSIWDPAIPNNINGMLSITMFIPIFSIISGMTITLVFKVVYPLLLSLVPLGMFHMFREVAQDDNLAFFACFYFVSIGEFFNEMLGLTRQGIAMFFITLIGCLTVSKVLEPEIKAALLILFLFSLVVSHYGTCYLFLLSCIIALFVSHILQTEKRLLLTSGFIILFGVFAVSWYMFMSSSSSFTTIVRIGDHIISNLSQMFVPDPESPVAYFTTFSSLSVNLSKVLHIINIFFIVIGVITSFERTVLYTSKKTLKDQKYKDDMLIKTFIRKEFAALSLAFFGCCIISVAVRGFSGMGSVGAARVYIVSLLFLAPFCVIGARNIIKTLTNSNNLNYLKFISVFFSVFLLVNSGFVNEIALKDYYPTVAVGKDRITKEGSLSEKSVFNWLYIQEKDVVSSLWLSKNRDERKVIYADADGKSNHLLSYGMLGGSEVGKKFADIYIIKENTIINKGYVYLTTTNFKLNIMLTGLSPCYKDFSRIKLTLKNYNKIYSNGGSVIYYGD